MAKAPNNNIMLGASKLPFLSFSLLINPHNVLLSQLN